MENIIEIVYKKHPQTLQISCGKQVFDTTRIADLPLEQWISPFFAKGIRWRGLYEELKLFTGNESFTLRFDSDDDSFALVKHALAGMPVKLIGTNNTVTIVYSEDPGTIDIFYRNPQLPTPASKTKMPESAVSAVVPIPTQKTKMPKMAVSGTEPDPTPRINMDRISGAANKTINAIKQNVENADHEANTDQIPIKNPFIRNNIMTICAVCAIVLLFLPFAGYSAVATAEGASMQSNVVRVSGFETMFGVKEIRVGLNHSVFGFLLLIVPVLIAGLNYIKPLKPYQKWIAVGAPLLGIIAEIITLFDVGKLFTGGAMAMDAKVKTSPGIGFILILVVYILMIAVGLILHHGMKVPSKKAEV